MSTKANPGAFDTYAAAEPNEPIFTLRANDPHASSLVFAWGALALHAKEDKAKLLDAGKTSADMALWAQEHEIKASSILDIVQVLLKELARHYGVDETIDFCAASLAKLAPLPQEMLSYAKRN